MTVGSPLTASFGTLNPGTPTTVANFVLVEPGANVTSPVSGTIVRWRITQATGGPFRLRVLSPVGGTTYTGAGTSEPRIPSSTATQTFTTNLPISAGQSIGLDLTNASDEIGIAGAAGAGSASWGFWDPPLAAGETRAATPGVSDEEVGFNADVATKPPNAFSLGLLTRNKNRGIAFLEVNVPGPGMVDLTGSGVKTQRAGNEAVASRVVSAGTVSLRIATKRSKKRKLQNTGRVKVGVNVTYTPFGDLPGDPNVQSRRVKLVKRH